MIRRYFLRILAASPLAGLAAVIPARGETVAPAWVGGLAQRMTDCHSIRVEIDKINTEMTTLLYSRPPRGDLQWVGVPPKPRRDLHWENLKVLNGRRWNYEQQLAALQRLPITPVKRSTPIGGGIGVTSSTRWGSQ